MARKFTFKTELENLKRLEARAESTGLDMYKKEAEIVRGLLMSYKGMSSELAAKALGRGDEAFQRRVSEAIERKDVEEIHRLWVEKCGGDR